MILTCPECNTRFLLPAKVEIPEEGRKVRCSACSHVWIQTSVIEEESPSSDARETPDKSKKADKKSKEKKGKKPKKKTDSRFTKDIHEGILPMLIGFLLTLGLFSYFIFAAGALIMGEGLSFNHMKVKRVDAKTIHITGEIQNRTDSKRGLLPLTAMLVTKSGTKETDREFAIDKKILNPGENVKISQTLYNVPMDIINVKMGFKKPVKGQDIPQEKAKEGHQND